MASTHMDLLEATVEVTKAALPMSSGTMINNPAAVAEFIEVIYNRFKELERTRYE